MRTSKEEDDAYRESVMWENLKDAIIRLNFVIRQNYLFEVNVVHFIAK